MTDLKAARTTLHIISCPPEATTTLDNCLAAAATGDSLILIGDGAYNAINPPVGMRCFALAEDVSKRSLGNQVAAAVELVDYPRFVELCVQHQPICSWY